MEEIIVSSTPTFYVFWSTKTELLKDCYAGNKTRFFHFLSEGPGYESIFVEANSDDYFSIQTLSRSKRNLPAIIVEGIPDKTRFISDLAVLLLFHPNLDMLDALKNIIKFRCWCLSWSNK